jgi:hypothetical protein
MKRNLGIWKSAMLSRKSSYLLARDRSGTYHIILHFALYLHSAIRV